MPYSGPRIPSPSSGNSSIWPYGYVPSLGLGIVGIITFLVVAMPHLWWFVKKRGTRSVHGLFFFAAIIEVLGYGARLSSHTYPFNGMNFLVGIYLVQIRGIKYTPEGRTLSPMRPRSMLTLFVILDVVWVIMQIGGQWLVSGAQAAEITYDEPMFGLGLVFLAGNVLQGITIILFLAFLLVIMRRTNRLLAHVDPTSTVQYPLLKPLWLQIAISGGLFLVRLVMRIAEGAQGDYSYSSTHGVFFGIFEYVPILLILVIWAARPLYKFIFPLGHQHSEGSHTRTFGTTSTGAGAGVVSVAAAEEGMMHHHIVGAASSTDSAAGGAVTKHQIESDVKA